MIDLSALLWVLAGFFAVLGWNRGWRREMIGTAGIILALFALFQFDSLLRGTLLANAGRNEVVLVQAVIFSIVVFFAYQSRTVFGNELRSGRVSDGRADYQNSVLGAIMGFINGYLIWGTFWYFIDINEYPLSPFIIAPAPGSPADNFRSWLPLLVLGGGVNGSGDYLAIAVIVLFVMVLILI
jgi:uncharacterized membrane protein required for colicin V production